MTVKPQLNSEEWDVELGHLSAFGWAVLFSCPVFGRMLKVTCRILTTGMEIFDCKKSEWAMCDDKSEWVAWW